MAVDLNRTARAGASIVVVAMTFLIATANLMRYVLYIWMLAERRKQSLLRNAHDNDDLEQKEISSFDSDYSRSTIEDHQSQI